MKKNTAFTLIEMLVVIIIIGVILAIAIPNVSSLIGNRSAKFYNQQMKLIESAMDGYVLKYKGELINNSSASCYVLPYQKLIEYNLITESEITCDGNIIIKKNEKNYSFEYYRTCEDKDGKQVSEAESLPSGCIQIN